MKDHQFTLPPAILSKIRHIEIYTRRLLAGGIIGNSRSPIKGTGLEFNQMRDYVVGDDIRYIDWNASSRLDRMVVREYVEERNKTILLVVDVSQSMFFGSPQGQTKAECVQQLAGVLALIGAYARDKIGLVMFSTIIEKYVPPRSGISHSRHVMELLFSHQPQGIKTSLSVALDFIAGLKIRNSVVFLLSDFIDDYAKERFCIVAKKHDLIAVACKDPYEVDLPSVGFLSMVDLETGQRAIVDLRKGTATQNISSCLKKQTSGLFVSLHSSGAHVLNVSTNNSFIDDVVKFFRRRMDY